MHVPFSLSAAALTRLAASLADPAVMTSRPRLPPARLFTPGCCRPLAAAPPGAKRRVFRVPFFAGGNRESPEVLADTRGPWLASLLRLEAGDLSRTELAESLRQRLSYSPSDLLACEWTAAVLVDRHCDETLQIIEFANVQLLEFRHIDRRLDQRLESAYDLIYPLARSWLPFWHTQTRTLRAPGEMKIEANAMFERAEQLRCSWWAINTWPGSIGCWRPAFTSTSGKRPFARRSTWFKRSTRWSPTRRPATGPRSWK